MSTFNCNCRCNCTAVGAVASVIAGIVAAFLQITGTITIAPVFLWVAFGIATVYLGVLVLVTAFGRRAEQGRCICNTLTAILAGILGTILFSLVLLAVGIVATSVVSAILVGLLVLFFALTLTGTACLIRCLADCES